MLNYAMRGVEAHGKKRPALLHQRLGKPRLIWELLARGASKIDKAAAYRLKIDLHVVKSENPKAVESALECLRLFGIDIPAHPTCEQVDAAYETVWNNLAETPIERRRTCRVAGA